MARAPASAALATATTIPRSLNEPVGFWPSTFRTEPAQAERLAEVRGVDERREALAQGQARGRVGHRQERAIALHQARAGRPGGSWSHQSSTGYRVTSDAVGQDRRRTRPGPPRSGTTSERMAVPSSKATDAASSRAVGQRLDAVADGRQERVPVARALQRRDRGDGRSGDAPAARPRWTCRRGRWPGGRPGRRCSSPRRRPRVPASRTVPSGVASISTRFVDAVRPAERAVGRDRRRHDRAHDGVAVAGRAGEQLEGQPQGGRALHLAIADAGDARVRRSRARSADGGRPSRDPATPRTRAGPG